MKEKEAKILEEKNVSLISSMQGKLTQLLESLEALKSEKKTLQELVKKAQENEKRIEEGAKLAEKGKAQAERDMLLSLTDPRNFLVAAKQMDNGQLRWINYQLGLLINSSYTPPPAVEMQPQPYPAVHPYYSYYQYPMLPMYGVYKDNAED